jgi:rod shape-determining protein MreC
MARRPYLLAFSVVLLIALAALNLPERQALRLKLAWGSVFMPLFGLAGSVQSLSNRTQQSLVPRTQLARENEALHHEIALLRFRIMQDEALRQENARLRTQVQWQAQTQWQLRLGRVIGHDPSNWWRSLWINLGERERVQVNMPVLTSDGLVGRVAEVAFTRSRVVLAGDPNCRVAGLVTGSRDKGIIVPDEGSFDRQVVNFTYVPINISLHPGAMVVTSGDGGVFPKGIPIGRIVDVETNEFELYLEARVRLNANLNQLEEVWVLFP